MKPFVFEGLVYIFKGEARFDFFFITFQQPVSLHFKCFMPFVWALVILFWWNQEWKQDLKRKKHNAWQIWHSKSANITKLFVESYFGFLIPIYKMIWFLTKWLHAILPHTHPFLQWALTEGATFKYFVFSSSSVYGPRAYVLHISSSSLKTECSYNNFCCLLL